MITTANKTTQQVLDEMAATLIKQGKQCLGPSLYPSDPDGTCLYGDGDGNHCAVGWLLPPDNDTLMNCPDGVIELVEEFTESELGENVAFLRENSELLELVQRLHDHKRFETRESILLRMRNEFPKLNFDAWEPWLTTGLPASIEGESK